MLWVRASKCSGSEYRNALGQSIATAELVSAGRLDGVIAVSRTRRVDRELLRKVCVPAALDAVRPPFTHLLPSATNPQRMMLLQTICENLSHLTFANLRFPNIFSVKSR